VLRFWLSCARIPQLLADLTVKQTAGRRQQNDGCNDRSDLHVERLLRAHIRRTLVDDLDDMIDARKIPPGELLPSMDTAIALKPTSESVFGSMVATYPM
jgi:hypothetical protein